MEGEVVDKLPLEDCKGSHVAQQGGQSCHGIQEEVASVNKIQAVVFDGGILPRPEDK